MKLRNAALVAAGAWVALRAYRSLWAYDFRGKSVLVTGGSRGLGLVLARELAREGVRLAICARDKEETNRAEQQLHELGVPVLALPCDLRDAGQTADLVQAVQDHYGQIDVLINNAGTIAVGPEQTMTRSDFMEAMAGNFFSALHTILAALPDMRRRRQGRIVNITSIGGKVSVPHLLPYSASKFALVGLSAGLRAELARDGIVVTTVCPGLMRTGSPRNAWFKGQHRKEYAWFAISDSLPLLSMSAAQAARRILGACRRGDAEVVLGLPAQAAVLVHGLFPGLVADLLALVNRFLPETGGIGSEQVRGADSQSVLAPSILTELTEQAAQRNNQIRPAEMQLP